MADDIDAMLKGEDEKTSSASPAGNKTQVSDSGEDITTSSEQQTPEEVEFNSLKGNTRERIQQLWKEKEDWKRKAALTTNVPPAPSNNQPNPDVQDAVRKLDEVGVATKDFVGKQVDQGLSQLRWNMELDRLEGKYDGEKDLPQFDRTEYYDYVGNHPEYKSYLPEDVFRYKMHKAEFDNWSLSHPARIVSNSNKSLKPTKTTSMEEPLSPEAIEARLKEPG